jgi:hypothetical protein
MQKQDRFASRLGCMALGEGEPYSHAGYGVVFNHGRVTSVQESGLAGMKWERDVRCWWLAVYSV